MKRISFFLLSFIYGLFFLNAQNTALDKLIKEINPQGFTGFELYDPYQEKTLYAYHSDKYFQPASNAKIFTFMVTEKFLGDSIATAYYHQSNDTLYLAPLADPTFLYKDFSSENIEKLFQKKDINVVAIDFSEIDIPPYAPGWTWDDYEYSYMPERHSFPFSGNVVRQEDLHYEWFETNTNIDRKRNFYRNEFHLKEGQTAPFITAKDLIIRFLNKIFDKNFIFSENKVPFNEHSILYSNPKKSVLKEMMLESDNFLAEQLAWNVSFTSGIEYEKLAAHFDPILGEQMPKLVDASGLSRYNLMTPHQLINGLTYIKSNIPNYLSYFPENGVSGTLESSYLTETSYIFAKTGSMSGVMNLSGYLKTDSGKLLIFSLMNNNFTSKANNLKPNIEKLLLYIKHNY